MDRKENDKVNEMIRPTKERKKQLIADFVIIMLASFLALGIVIVWGSGMYEFGNDRSVPIVLRVLAIGACQFGISGLGITLVCLLRKEKFTQFGLNTKNLAVALPLSLACCIPDLIYQLIKGNVHAWRPFWDVNSTPEVLSSGFLSSASAMLITALCWGFFEGFNYVVIRDKLSELLPSKCKFLD